MIRSVFLKRASSSGTGISIPKLLEDACFRTTEQFMNKATAFIKGYFLKKGDDEVHDLLRRPRRAGLKTFYTALLISIRTLQGRSL